MKISARNQLAGTVVSRVIVKATEVMIAKD